METKQLYKMLNMVKEFYEVFDQGNYMFNGRYANKDRKKLREKLFNEELKEYLIGEFREGVSEEERQIEKLDAICDMYYIAIGNVLEKSKDRQDSVRNVRTGKEFELRIATYYQNQARFNNERVFKAFEEVHRSNMSKLGLDGKPVYREDGKIIKGPNYFPPDLRKFFRRGA